MFCGIFLLPVSLRKTLYSLFVGVVGDQQSALFGSSCFSLGETKVGLGTGSFLDVNTGTICRATNHNIYPIVGWKIGKEVRKKRK